MINPFETIRKKIEEDQPNLWEKEFSLKRKDFLKVRGSIDTNVYYVAEGSLRIFIENEFEEQVIRFGYPGSIIAALDSFLHEQPSPFYIQAIKKCRLLKMSKGRFMQFINSDPESIQLWQKVLEISILHQMEREIDILTSSPLERYQRVMKRSPHLFQLIPNKYIASYLRMTPETLSRIKSMMLKDGE